MSCMDVDTLPVAPVAPVDLVTLAAGLAPMLRNATVRARLVELGVDIPPEIVSAGLRARQLAVSRAIRSLSTTTQTSLQTLLQQPTAMFASSEETAFTTRTTPESALRPTISRNCSEMESSSTTTASWDQKSPSTPPLSRPKTTPPPTSQKSDA